MGDVLSSIGSEHEEVLYFADRETGLRGITVLDDVRLGPAVGACRSRLYDEEERALADALRQARTTTAKALIADLPISGGCSVLLNDPMHGTRPHSPMPALGRAVESLDGRYYLLPDLQGHLTEMDEAATVSSHVLGCTEPSTFDAIEAAAVGNLIGIETAAKRRLGVSSLMRVSIGLIGLSPVGFRLAELLRQEGARLTVADRDPRRTEQAVRQLGISCVTVEEIIHLDNTVLVSSAAKDSIEDWMLSHLRCQIVAGAVDDPLSAPSHGQALHDRGILYAPDTIINAGGLICLTQPLLSDGEKSTPLHGQLQQIGIRINDVIDQSQRMDLPTSMVAERMADDARSARLQVSGHESMAG
jgi:leucine dehydrogenase